MAVISVWSISALAVDLNPLDCVRGVLQFAGAPRALRADEISYHVYGAGNPETIVLIHGLGGDSSTWREIAAALKSRYRVIVYDQRGHGLTTALGENYSSTLLARDLHSLLDSLHVKKATILGHSMGARTAVRFADLYPERTQNVIVEDMHMLGRHTILPKNIELSRALKALPKEFDSREQAYARLKDLMSEKAALDFSGHSMHRNFNGSFSFNTRLDTLVLYEPQGLQEDLTGALKAVKAPMLFMAADPDRGAVLFGKGIDALKEAKPEAQLQVFKGAGHGIHHSQPDEFLAAVRNFVSTHGGPH